MNHYLLRTECVKDGHLLLALLKEAHFNHCNLRLGIEPLMSNYTPGYIDVACRGDKVEAWLTLKLEQPNDLKCGVEIFKKV